MAKTKIPWADVTENPFKVAEQGVGYENAGGVLIGKGRGFHCTKVSPGCARCYAEAMNLNSFYGWANLLPYDDRALPLVFDHECMERLERKRSPALVFVQSMSDVFHPDVPADFIDLLLMYIEGTPKHFFLLLTKRPENVEAKLPARLRIPGAKFPDNLGIGVSVENADYLWRVDELFKIPARLRFVSFEPLLGPWGLDYYTLTGYRGDNEDTGEPMYAAGIDWVIVGAESLSGRPGRTCEPRWIADIMAGCGAAGVPLFIKQAVDYTTGKLVKMPRLAADGRVNPGDEPARVYREYPAVLKEHFDRWTTGR